MAFYEMKLNKQEFSCFNDDCSQHHGPGSRKQCDNLPPCVSKELEYGAQITHFVSAPRRHEGLRLSCNDSYGPLRRDRESTRSAA